MIPVMRRRSPCSGALVFGVLLLGSFCQAQDDSSSKRDSWYTRYSAYPPYCSRPQEMANRTIPPVSDDPRIGESRLVHVSAIIRHGARTPWKGDISCWDGYHQSPETGVWNCDLTTFLSPPPPDRIHQEENDSSAAAAGGQAMFLFEKHFDALLDPGDNLSNELNGTCQRGQLLLQGYEQELTNGKHLRSAYLYDERHYDHDPRMRLIDVSGTTAGQEHPWDEKCLFYRVDDDQRTLMSGQVLLRGMLGEEMAAYVDKQKQKHYPVVALHTADRSRDIVDPNERICPRLAEIRERFERSTAFQSFNESAEAQTLRDFQHDVLGLPKGVEMDALDCLMTTICTDRPLPDAVNDYTGDDGGRRRRQHEDDSDSDSDDHDHHDYGTNMFQRLYDFDVKRYALSITDDDAAYAKLAMGPLWAEIMANVYAIIQEEARSCCPTRQPVKLAIFSGHDTTLMPLLASLGPRVWDGQWPPYASMMLIEIHEVNIDGQTDKSIYKSNYAFRLLYNGKVLTHLVDGCPDDAELCDAEILAARVKPFATRNGDCSRQYEVPQKYTDTLSRTVDILSTTGGIIAFVLVVLGSAFLGALVTFFYLTGSLPSRKRKASAVNGAEESGIALTRTSEYGSYSDEPEVLYDRSNGSAEHASMSATLT